METKELTFIGKLEKTIQEYATSNPDGFTVDISTNQPITEGFAVAYLATQNSHDARGLKRCIIHSINAGNKIIGGWLNKDNGSYYYDSTKIFDNKDAAIEFGRKNKQIAIYDIAGQTEIRL